MFEIKFRFTISESMNLNDYDVYSIDENFIYDPFWFGFLNEINSINI